MKSVILSVVMLFASCGVCFAQYDQNAEQEQYRQQVIQQEYQQRMQEQQAQQQRQMEEQQREMDNRNRGGNENNPFGFNTYNR